MKLSDLYLNRFLYRDNNQNLETKDSSFVSTDSSEAEPASIPSGGAAQDINTGNVQIDGAQIEDGTIPTTTLDVSNWGWGQTCAFVSSTLNTVTWGAGTFTSADGTAYSIDAGSTGVMAAKTYIYLSLLDSETVYQKTTTSSDAVGLGKVLIAVAENGITSATYMLSEATQIVGDNIIANTIDASKITTGQLIVGTNVGLGTAKDSAGVTTIVGNVVTTGYVNALNITAQYVVASISISSPSIIGGSIAIGSSNNIFKADANGIYLGNAAFGSAPFRVTMAGAVTASSITLTNASVGTGSTWTGNSISSAYIGNLDAGKITTGSLSVARTDATNGATFNSNISGGGTGTDQIGNNGYITNISGGTITTGTLNASVVSVTNINASNISTGTLSASRIATGSLNANKISSNTITGSQITTSLLSTTSQYISAGLKVGGSGASMGTGIIYATAYITAPKIKLIAGTSNPSVAGDIVNYASGATDQFRGRPGDGTWTGSFDMTSY